MNSTFLCLSVVLLLGCHKSTRLPSKWGANGSSPQQVSIRTHAMGVSQINAISTTDIGQEFKLEGPALEKKFSYEFPSEDRLILHLTDVDFPATIEMDKSSGTIVYKERNIDLTSDADISMEEQTNIFMAITIFRELTENLERAPFTPERTTTKCMKGAVSFRKTKSESIETLNKFVETYLSKHPDCKRKYGVDTGCIWGDFICVSGQQMECDCK